MWFLGSFAVILGTFYNDFIVFPVIWEAWIAISLGFYKDLFLCCKRFWGVFFHVLQVSKLWRIPVTVYLPRCSKTSFGDPWGLLSLLGGSLGNLLFSVGFGSFFLHRFGRCPKKDDFLEEFVFQSTPKRVLVTLAPFGPPGGNSFDGLAPQIRVFTVDL